MSRYDKALTYFIQRCVVRTTTTDDGVEIIFDNGRVVCASFPKAKPSLSGLKLVTVDYDDESATMHFFRPAQMRESSALTDVKVVFGSYKVDHVVCGFIDPHAIDLDHLPPDPSCDRVADGPAIVVDEPVRPASLGVYPMSNDGA